MPEATAGPSDSQPLPRRPSCRNRQVPSPAAGQAASQPSPQPARKGYKGSLSQPLSGRHPCRRGSRLAAVAPDAVRVEVRSAAGTAVHVEASEHVVYVLAATLWLFASHTLLAMPSVLKCSSSQVAAAHVPAPAATQGQPASQMSIATAPLLKCLRRRFLPCAWRRRSASRTHVLSCSAPQVTAPHVRGEGARRARAGGIVLDAVRVEVPSVAGYRRARGGA